MLLIFVDAVTLFALIKIIQEEDIGLGIAVVVSLVAGIITGVLAIALAAALGWLGVLLAGLIGAAGVGVAVSALFGIEIKRSLLIGGIFTAVHMVAWIGLSVMSSSG